MLVAAIKCDLCKKTFEISCRKAGEKPEVPDGWATISPLIHIKGTPKDVAQGGGKYAPNDPAKQKLYRERRDALRKQFEKHHACEDCCESILTGKISLKIGSNDGQDQ